jgi:hypothetical protein
MPAVAVHGDGGTESRKHTLLPRRGTGPQMARIGPLFSFSLTVKVGFLG